MGRYYYRRRRYRLSDPLETYGREFRLSMNTGCGLALDTSPSTDQQMVLDTIRSERGPFFVTGPAGSGKSALIDHIRRMGDVAVCATTGIAAQLLLGGKTVHSYFGINPQQPGASGVDDNKYANKRIQVAKTIVIDEISMASSELLDQIMERFKLANHYPKLVLVGDFLQLPPVQGSFIFENPKWKHFKLLRLTTIHRQKDKYFVEALNDLRIRKMTDRVKALIESRRVAELPKDCTQLYPHKANVEEENLRRLEELPGEPMSFDWEVESRDEDERIFSSACAKARLPKNLVIKTGARVCMLTNYRDVGHEVWVNGSTGEVVGMEGSAIRVKLDRGYEVKVERTREPVFSGGKSEPDLTVLQYPMMLAWALTVHKAQGMTMDRVGVDLSNHFAPGMTYVALSRCKTAEGLHLVGNMTTLVPVNRRAMELCNFASDPKAQP